LTSSDVFADSAVLTSSDVFADSAVLTSSDVFAGSAFLTNSDVFAGSNILAHSDVFEGSAVFSASALFPSSAVFAGSAVLAHSNVFANSDVFASSALFSGSAVFSASALFSASLVFSISALFSSSAISSGSAVFLGSASFSRSTNFPSSNSLLPNDYGNARVIDSLRFRVWLRVRESIATEPTCIALTDTFPQSIQFTSSNKMIQSPSLILATPEAPPGEEYSAIVITSYTQISVSQSIYGSYMMTVELTTFVWLEHNFFVQSNGQSSLTQTVSPTITLTLHEFITFLWFEVPIHIVISTVSFVRRPLFVPSEPEEPAGPASNAVIIGAAAGSAVVVAVLIGIAVMIIRLRLRKEDEDEEMRSETDDIEMDDIGSDATDVAIEVSDCSPAVLDHLPFEAGEVGEGSTQLDSDLDFLYFLRRTRIE
jgi:hypothetical protein